MFTDTRPCSIKDAAHIPEMCRVIPMHTLVHMVGVSVSPNDVRTIGHNHRIANARVTVIMQVRRNVFPSIDAEFVVRPLKLPVSFLRVVFILRIKKCAVSLEASQVSKFVKIDWRALFVLHPRSEERRVGTEG